MADTLRNFLHDILTVDDVPDAAHRLLEAGESVGLRAAPCSNIASARTINSAGGENLVETLFGWTAPDERWWAIPMLALVSPVAHACRYESEPFWANANGFYGVNANSYLREIKLHDFSRYVVSKSVLTVPVHLPFGQIGMVCWVPMDDREDLSDIFAQHANDLQILSHRFLAGYVKVMRRIPGHRADGELTRREVECLRWAAQGKTDKEISIILGRSHATVRFHIQNAGEKLDSVNRSQAIFKAAQLGYLGMPH
jgi:LuxR family transcriptional regulator, quorum-sensing system regulator CciR